MAVETKNSDIDALASDVLVECKLLLAASAAGLLL